MDRPLIRRPAVTMAAGALATALLALPAFGQGEPSRQTLGPFDVSGRDFAGYRLPLAPTPGVLSFSAIKAHVWTERPFAAGGRVEPPVQRLLLQGNVEVTLGSQTFRAQRAVVWLKRLADEEAPGERLFQTHVVLDQAWTPLDEQGVGVSASRLPVEAVVQSDERIRLHADVVLDGREEGPLLRQAEEDLARLLRRRLGVPVAGAATPPPAPDPEAAEDLQRLLGGLERAEHRPPIFAQSGTISFQYGELTAVRGEQDNAVMLTGGVSLLYSDPASGRSLEMRAQRAVVFLPPGPVVAVLQNLTPDQLRGIYLEGGVFVTDGEYSLRAPKVFYDIASDRAVVLDAVLWTYHELLRMPLYLRAAALRQESADQFTAERASIANSSFAEPQFSVGARRLTLSRRPQVEGEDRFWVQARDVTLQAGSVPFFYLPSLEGDPRRFPLRRLGFDSAAGSGLAVRTGWGAESLLGITLPGQADATLIGDLYFERGLALGADVSWDRPDLDGLLRTYVIFGDEGEDRLHTGARLDHDGDTRGMAVLEQRWTLDPQTTLWLDGAWFSDETFIDGFFEPLGYSREPFTTGFTLQRRGGNQAITLEAQGQLNDFIVNEFALQTPGYVTQKLPEASYTIISQDLLAETAPGLFTLTSEFSAAHLKLNFHEPTAREIGYINTTLSQAAFGIDPDESIADRLRARGFTEDSVFRFDTRHEIAMTTDVGPLRLRPFVVGRGTLYDQSFEAFSPEEDDEARAWGAAGVTASTTIIRSDDGVESSLLDLHRLRHVIEPSVTLWTAHTNVRRGDLPVYDHEVENILDGSVVRFALEQTFQTKRGGPGRWQSVDVLTIDAELVLTDDAGEASPVGRFFQHRPELGTAGDFAAGRAMWRATDALAFAGGVIYDLDEEETARTSVGVLVDHSPVTSTSVELRSIEPLDSTYLDLVNRYAIGDKYQLFSSASYDVDEDDFRRFSVELARELPALVVGFGITYDNIQDTTSFGFSLQPRGLAPLRFRGIGGPSQGTSFGS